MISQPLEIEEFPYLSNFGNLLLILFIKISDCWWTKGGYYPLMWNWINLVFINLLSLELKVSILCRGIYSGQPGKIVPPLSKFFPVFVYFLALSEVNLLFDVMRCWYVEWTLIWGGVCMIRCLAPDCQVGGLGCDNMTVVLVCFLHNQPYSVLVQRCAEIVRLRDQQIKAGLNNC